MEKEEKIALIDADSIPYICSKENIIESIANVDSIITSICNTLEVNKFVLCLSKPPYFRLKYNKDYKGNRTGISTLKWLRTLKNYLKEGYNCTEVEGLEADDLCAYFKNSDPEKFIVCSIDKDVLNQIVGNNYNYKKREYINTNEDQASYFLAIQQLIGDPVDGIPNIKKGYGIKTAEKYLKIDSEYIFPTKEYYNTKVEEAYYNIYGNYKFHNEVFGQVYLLQKDEDLKLEGFDVTSVKNSIKINELKTDGNDRDSW